MSVAEPLAAWQQGVLDAVLSGRQVVFTAPRHSGRSVVERALTEAGGFEPLEPRRSTSPRVRVFYDEVPQWDVPPGPTGLDALTVLCLRAIER